MTQGTKQKFEEVKLALQRLQRIGLEADDGEAPVLAAGPHPAAEPQPKARPVLEAEPPATPEQPPAPNRPAGRMTPRFAAYGAAGLAAFAVAAGLAAWWLIDRPLASPPAAVAAIDAPARQLSEAQGLIDAGRVAEARRALADLAPRSPDAAFMLARSYDPNTLRRLPAHDAAPDIAEAERWYRAWHAIASKNGIELEAERLERIIAAMK